MKRIIVVAIAIFGVLVAVWMNQSTRSGAEEALQKGGQMKSSVTTSGRNGQRVSKAPEKHRAHRRDSEIFNNSGAGIPEGNLKSLLSRIEVASKEEMPDLLDEALQFPEEERIFAVHLVVDKWVSMDPLDAAAYSETLPNKEFSSMAALAVLSSWPSEILEEGLEWAKKMTESGACERAVTIFLGRAASLDPSFVARSISEIEDKQHRLSIVAQLASVWAQTDHEVALDWAKSLSAGGLRSQALYAIGSELAISDPFKALDIVDVMGYGSHRDELLRSVAGEWIRVDEDQALRWFRNLDSADMKVVVGSVSSSWARVDPRAAAEFGGQLRGEERSEYIVNVLREWGEQDPIAALEWSGSTEFVESEDVMKSLFGSWSASNPGEAAEHLAEVDSSILAPVTREVVMNWAAMSPEEASAFAEELPDGSAKVDAVAMTAIRWSRIDSEATSEWLMTLDSGEARDRGVIEMVNAISSSDPKSALKWILSVDNLIAREQWIERVGGSWIKRDPERAVQEIEAMGLGDREMRLMGLR